MPHLNLLIQQERATFIPKFLEIQITQSFGEKVFFFFFFLIISLEFPLTFSRMVIYLQIRTYIFISSSVKFIHYGQSVNRMIFYSLSFVLCKRGYSSLILHTSIGISSVRPLHILGHGILRWGGQLCSLPPILLR